MPSNPSLSAELAEAIEEGRFEAWRCPICKAELYDDCSMGPHLTAINGLSTYLRRTQRVWEMRLRAIGGTP